MLKSTRIHAEDLARAASDRCVEERSARMAIADTTNRSVRTVADLRRSRRALRAESAQLGRWRRLVRARMDLALATSMAPEPLGLETLGLLPPHVGDDLPMYKELLERGDVLFREGEPGDRLYVIATGKVKVGRRAPDGRENLLAVLGPGEMIGELSLFDPGARTATATAVADTSVYELAHSGLVAWIEQH